MLRRAREIAGSDSAHFPLSEIVDMLKGLSQKPADVIRAAFDLDEHLDEAELRETAQDRLLHVLASVPRSTSAEAHASQGKEADLDDPL